jgi:hypothetical protein
MAQKEFWDRRFDVLLKLSRHDFARAAHEVQRMNDRIVNYELRNIEDHDLADQPQLDYADLSSAKMVTFSTHQLFPGYIERSTNETVWINPDYDMHLPNATLIAHHF